ncbi:MAG: rhodanese-like domain-containing protein [Pseudomonadota bacterium]|nr:rhodanese-like domain-containing protein [Pseudomonadota bacterium]
MKHPLFTTAILLAALIGASQAAEKPADPARQTSWNLYLDSREAHDMKVAQGDKVLLVDVRDPIEIMFTGFTDMVDINIPIQTADRSHWDAKKPVFNMVANPRFADDIAAVLEARGLNKDAPIIIMCRSGGERGAPSAKVLEGKGYKSVYVVVDGFEGDTVKSGERKNWRTVNGWKNSGLPWSYKLNKDKMYLPR